MSTDSLHLDDRITFSCEGCGKKLRVSSEKAGMRGRCPHCKRAAVVPMPQAPSARQFVPESLPVESPVSAWAAFLSDLRVVCDAELPRDPDDLTFTLANRFGEWNAARRKHLAQFVSELKAVNDAEGNRDPEDYLPLLTSRLEEWRTHSFCRMKAQLENLPEDDPLRCPFGLFDTLGLARRETAHTAALAWLLDPRQSHGFGTALLRALLLHVSAASGQPELQVEHVAAEHRAVLGGKHQGRIDVFALGAWTDGGEAISPWVLAIEAKIDADEGEDQLARYEQWIDAYHSNKEKYRVFLTPEGRCPEAEKSDWMPLSFLELVRIFRRVYPAASTRTRISFSAALLGRCAHRRLSLETSHW